MANIFVLDSSILTRSVLVIEAAFLQIVAVALNRAVIPKATYIDGQYFTGQVVPFTTLLAFKLLSFQPSHLFTQ